MWNGLWPEGSYALRGRQAGVDYSAIVHYEFRRLRLRLPAPACGQRE